MPEIAIRVENLGKKYTIGHRARNGQSNFRETVTEGAKRLFRFKRQASVETEEFWALRDASMEIRRGEVLGVIGRNGAGKSTFLKLLSRITEPTKGRIEYSGKVASLLEVGTGFHPELSGRENIFLNGAILGMRRDEIRKRFDEIVAFAEIEQFLDTPVKRYSSGMYMRLAFAVAAHLEPDILLVDEVLAVGDAEFQKKCLGKMNQVAREGARTVIFVSHNLQAVKSLCSQTAHFHSGRVIQYGPTEQVVRDYMVGTSSAVSKWVADEPDSRGDLQLLSVEVSDSDGSAGVYLSSSDLTVTVAFRLRNRVAGLCLGFDLVTSDGTTVFRTFHTDQSEPDWPRQLPGDHRWVCKIPGGMLNAGTYCVSPRVALHNVGWILTLDGVLRFDVELSHGDSPYWNSSVAKARPGVIAPILRWAEVSESGIEAGYDGSLHPYGTSV